VQYEAPRIVRRERNEALLAAVGSNVDGIGSDVNTKERIVAVCW